MFAFTQMIYLKLITLEKIEYNDYEPNAFRGLNVHQKWPL